MARYEESQRRGGWRRDRDRSDDRGYGERAGDEVRSWFGDEEAERRRRADQRRDREREWREWDRREALQHGRDYPLYDVGFGPRADWYSSRAREWRDYDRSRQRQYEATRRGSGPGWDRGAGERYWSPYESDRGEYAAGAQGAMPVTTAWGRGPKGYRRGDERITDDVCERLTYSPLDASDIEVQVRDGEVTLSGSVNNRWEKRQAEDLVENVFGVREVHNNLRVMRSSAATVP